MASSDTSAVEKYVRLFSFGTKLSLLITGLAVPAALWALVVFVLVPAMKEWPTFYALTNNETSSDKLTLELTLRLLSLSYPDVLTSPPGLLEGRVPESARTLVGRKVRPLGRLAQATVVIVISLVCFALYFPLGGAIISFFKKGRI